MVVDNLVKVGGETKSVGDVLQGGGAGSTSFWDGDVDDDPLHGPVHWRVQHRAAIWITGRQTLQFLDESW